MEKYYLIVTYILVSIVGICVGSFLNVVIYRLPNNMSLVKPNSHCPKCNYELHWYDNIPIISYLLLKGRCRKCKEKISIRYTIVEIINGLLWVLCLYLFLNKSIIITIIYMIILSIFICIFFIDLEHKIILDRFQIMLLILSIIITIIDKENYLEHIIGGLAGFIIFLLIAILFLKIKHQESLGGGDIKLVGVIGLLLGWKQLLLSLLIATIPAAIIMTIINRKTNEEKEFPFAPFLVIGFTISLLFGSNIINWYLSLFSL